MKVARWRSLELRGVWLGSFNSVVEMSEQGESPFSILVDTVMDEDVDRAMELAHSDLPMLNSVSVQAHLKRAHSPRPKWRVPGGSRPKLGTEVGYGKVDRASISLDLTSPSGGSLRKGLAAWLGGEQHW